MRAFPTDSTFTVPGNIRIMVQGLMEGELVLHLEPNLDKPDLVMVEPIWVAYPQGRIVVGKVDGSVKKGILENLTGILQLTQIPKELMAHGYPDDITLAIKALEEVVSEPS